MRLWSHPELEAQLAAAPDDGDAWLVYEDWLLSVGDPRAALIERERAGDVTGAAVARGALEPLLLGPRAPTFASVISAAVWRAGFVRAATFDATGARGLHRLADFLAAPATRFLRELRLAVRAARAEAAATVVRTSGRAQVLRRLAIVHSS